MTILEMPKIFPVASHTDNVGQGSTFVVIKGLSQDGVEFIPNALQKGATRIVVEKNVFLSEEIVKLCNTYNASIEYVDNARKELAYLSAHEAGYPARHLKLYGVTGTKGKTSSVWILYHMLCGVGKKAALISTVGNYIGDTVFNAGMTTPQPDYIHQFLKVCLQQGVTYVVMETAAQASTFFRLETLEFDALIFTNLDQEHGELYPTLDEYFEAKKNICTFLKPNALLVINKDTFYGEKLAQFYPAAITFSLKDTQAQWRCAWETDLNYKNILILEKLAPIAGNASVKYVFTYTQFMGLFNAYNVLGVLLVLLYKKFFYGDIQRALNTIPLIPGRMEKYRLKNGATLIIDYAHTPSSFEALFKTLFSPSVKLFIVFGAGGGKDTTKRPIMGQLAAMYGEKVYITNDNPRYEDPVDIAYQICSGISEELRFKVIVELDRQKAIEHAIRESNSSTLILLLGKGPDEYQIIQQQKLFFSERLIALQYQ